MVNNNLQSPLGNINGRPTNPSGQTAKKAWRGAAAVAILTIGLGVSGVFAVALSFIGNLLLSVGSAQSELCTANSTISFTQSVNSSGTVEIDELVVEGIPSECDGEIVAVVIYDSSSTILDEVIWTLALTTGDSEISAVADGTTTDSSNASSAGVSTNYPASQTDPEGLAQNLVASDIDSVEFLRIGATRAARE